jgi:hypothetical protein
MDRNRGRVRVKGPLGLSRVAVTSVVAADPPRTLRGRAELGPTTCGAVRWEIEPDADGSRVTLTAEVERASLLDRVLLLCGARWWLARVVERAVVRLGTSISGT